MISTNYGNCQAIQNSTVNFKGAGNVSNLGSNAIKKFPILKKVKIDCLPDLAKNTVMIENGQISDSFIKDVEKAKTPKIFTDIINNSQSLNEVEYLQNCVRAFAGYYCFGAAKARDFLNMLTAKKELFSLNDNEKYKLIISKSDDLDTFHDKLSPQMQEELDDLNDLIEDNADFTPQYNYILNSLYAFEHKIKNL